MTSEAQTLVERLAELIQTGDAVRPIPGSLFAVHLDAIREAAAHIAKLEAALETSQASVPWRAIEDEAPLDGSSVLLWTTTRNEPDEIEYIELVCEGGHVDMVQIGYYDGDWGWQTEKIGTPTHWSPLPGAPCQSALLP